MLLAPFLASNALPAVAPHLGYSMDDSYLAPASPVNLYTLCKLDTSLTIFNAKTGYSAVGDGVTDDTVAIRNCLAAAVANGSGIVYLPAGTYAVDPQNGDPLADGVAPAIFTINCSNITVIGDHDPSTGAPATHIKCYMPGLADPNKNWTVVNNALGHLQRFCVFAIGTGDATGNLTAIQLRSLDINGQATYTGDASVGGRAVLYTLGSGTGSSPASGKCNFNNATPTSATVFYLNVHDLNGTDQTTVLTNSYATTALPNAGVLSVYDSTSGRVYTITVSSGSISGGVCTLNLSAVSQTVAGSGFTVTDGIVVLNGDGWDLTNKCLLIGGTSHTIDKLMAFNCTFRNCRGELFYSGAGSNLIQQTRVLCTIQGSNADGVSTGGVGASLTAHCTIGGSGTNQLGANGFEDYMFAGGAATVQDCTITYSVIGLSMLGEIGSSWTLQRCTIDHCATAGVLPADFTNNVLIDSVTFGSNCANAIEFYQNGADYPGVTQGFNNFTVSNNTFNGSSCFFGCQGVSVNGCSLEANTVNAGDVLANHYGTMTDFTVDGTILNSASTGSYSGDRAIWTNTTRSESSFPYNESDHYDDFTGASSGNISFASDVTAVNSNTQGSNPYTLIIDPAIMANYPDGFITTLKPGQNTNWYLKADSTNTLSSNTAVGTGLTIKKISGKFVQQ